jgi:phosphatidate cytidylyltransferase
VSELAPASAGRVTLALVGGLSLVLVAERRHLTELWSRVLFVRWRTWAIAAPLFGAAVLGPVPLAVAFVAALSAQGLRELSVVAGLPDGWRRMLVVAGAASAPLAVVAPRVWRGLPLVILLAASLAVLVRQDLGDVRHLAWAVFGWLWVPHMLGHFLFIREQLRGGPGLLLAIGTGVALSDVVAFAVGTLAGRHTLAPALSPGKTWEGVAGNVVGASLGVALMGFALPPHLPPPLLVALPFVVAAGCVWGDLLESAVKRHFGTKDAGTCLPGFGGVLDRIDSLLVVLPLTYWLLAACTR